MGRSNKHVTTTHVSTRVWQHTCQHVSTHAYTHVATAQVYDQIIERYHSVEEIELLKLKFADSGIEFSYGL